MRRLLTLSLIVVWAAPMIGSQMAPGQQGVMLSQTGAGAITTLVVLHQTAFYLGEPSASVPAEAADGTALIASRFTVRAWSEGGKARVVVSAVVPDARPTGGQLETPIATYLLAHGESTLVTETARWGAAPVAVRLVQRLRR